MNQPGLIFDIEKLIRDAETELSKSGYPAETIDAASNNVMIEPEIILFQGDELTDDGRWVQSLQEAVQAKKALSEGNHIEAELGYEKAEKWALRARTATNVNRGHDDKLQRQKNAEKVNQGWVEARKQALLIASSFIESKPPGLSKAMILDHVSTALIRGKYKTPGDKKLWNYLTEGGVIPCELQKPGRRSKK